MMENVQNVEKKYPLSQKRLKLNLQTQLTENAKRLTPTRFSILMEKIKCFDYNIKF